MIPIILLVLLLLIVLAIPGARKGLGVLILAAAVLLCWPFIAEGASDFLLSPEILVTAGFIAGAAALVFYLNGKRARDEASKARDKKQQQAAYLASLKQEYAAAIASRDKPRVLAAGRAYYAALRGGVLNPHDEQALANDLAALS